MILPVGAADDPGLEDILLTYLEPADRRTIARCCAVDSFDEAMFNDVLRDPDGQDLRALVADGSLVRLTGRQVRYRVSPALRDCVPPTLAAEEQRAIAVELERYCETNGLPVDRLRALILLGQELAVEGFEKAFDAAAKADDLPTCLRLLHVADTAVADQGLVGSRLAASAARNRRIYTVLDLAHKIGLRREDYLTRPDIEDELQEWLDKRPASFAVPVRGSAGRGKSTTLRQLVAGWLTADMESDPPTRVCAFLDFDELDSELAVDHPWLVALEIANQLEKHLPDREFGDLIEPYRRYLTALWSGPRPAQLDPRTAIAGQEGDRFVDRLLALLVDALDGITTLIVLDTFEEVMLLKGQRTPIALTGLLRRLHVAQPRIRLLISARGTDQEDDLLAEHLGVDEQPIEVPPLEDDQSMAYLIEVRHVGREELVDAMVDKAKGSLWELALAADIVESNRDITEQEIRSLDIELAWAVDRVIARIDEPGLRWVVRYGCLANWLTREIVEEVVLPTIEDVLTHPGLDDVSQDSFPSSGHVAVFPTAIDLPPVDELWNSLLRFRSDPVRSWLSATEGTEGEAVRFADELRAPFDALLAERPGGRLLHERLWEFHARRARTRDEGWFGNLRQAIHHRSRVGPAYAAEAWWNAAAEARKADRPDWSAALAKDLVEYYDAKLQPAPSGNMIAAAHLELAWTGARQALYDRGDSDGWLRVDRHLEEAVQGGADRDEWTIPAVRSALDLATDRPEDAIRRLEQLTATDRSEAAADRRDARVILADAYCALGRTDAAAHVLAEAATLTAPTSTAPDVLDAIARRQVHCAVRRGDLAAAGIHVSELQIGEERSHLQARTALMSGKPSTARELVGRDRTNVELVEALIELCRPVEALAACTKALAETTDLPSQARMLMARGLAHAALLDVDAALLDLHEAATAHGQLRDTSMQALCGAHLFRVYLRDVGDVRAARHQLDELGPRCGARGTTTWRRYRLLRAELAHRRSDPDAAVAEITELLDHLGGARQEVDPRAAVAAAVGAFCWAPQLAARATSLLLVNLRRLTPVTARLAALVDVEHVETGTLPVEVLDLVTAPGGQSGDALDRAWQRGRQGEVGRAVGESAAGVAGAAAMLRELGKHSGYAHWQWLQAVDRLTLPRVRRIDSSVLKDDPDCHDAPLRHDHEDHRLLRAANMLTVLRLRSDELGKWRFVSLLDWAEELLAAPAEMRLSQPTRRRTRWHLLAHELRQKHGPSLELPATTRLRQQDAADVAAELEFELGATSAPEPGPTPFPDDELALTVELEPTGPLVVRVGMPGHTEALRLRADDGLVSALQRGLGGRPAVAGLLRDGVRAGDVFRFQDLVLPGDARVDVRITEPEPAAPLPWELGMVGGRPLTRHPRVGVVYRHRPGPERTRTRVLQEVLNAAGFGLTLDGEFGPATRAAVGEVKRRAGLPLDTRPDSRAWRSLRSAVRRRPVEFVVGDRVALPREAPDERFDVLRVVGRIQDLNGVPYLSPAVGGRIHLHDVANLVTAMAGKSGREPLIVIEARERPTFTSETLLELLSRNAFAHALAQRTAVLAVLGTGLAVAGSAEAARSAFEQGLAEEETVADLALRLQHGAPPDATLQDSLPWTATALFTALRPSDLPPIGFSA